MLRTPPKRTASHSPDNARPYKRIATSSPEEGEVNDDELPVANALLRTPPRPISPPRPPHKYETKVKYPFKRKESVAQLPPKPGPKEKESAVIYERSEEDEWRIREKEQQRKQWSSHSELSRRVSHYTKPNSVDHWEPSLDYASRDKERSRLPGSGWQYDQHAASRNRRGTATSNWDSYPARSRGRSSPSPSRSITPSSTPTRRGKHRLPSHRDRSPVFNFSPPQRDYGVDRIRDKQREKEDAWDRDRDLERHYDGDYGRRDDRGNGDYDDRYWRPEGSPSRQDYANHDDYGARRRGMDSYRPASPGPSARTISTSAYPPRSPSPQHTSDGPRTPPPPSEPPPPPPPLTSPKNEILPTSHPAVSISLPIRRPGAPLDVHSPTPLPLPPANESVVKREHERKESEGEVKELREVKKRIPVRRSRKEEYEAYGRPFEGCGMQSDYDVTTKLGEGTFGEVHKAIHRSSRRVVALKRILMHNEKEGMPVTALREIKILKALKHPCIVEILDMFVVRSNGKDSPLSVYMVFPYMDHDLAGLLENERVKLQPSHIKLYMKQLLEGTEYMHRNHILHRDMKAANLLISNDGSLRIADFGLARAFDPAGGRGHDRGKERKYTNCVVTRWYRPPELLLGARQYGGEVDIWGIGCVLGEMFMRRPILPGTTDVDQLEKIWALCGTPNQHTWPNYDDLPGCEGVKRFDTTYSRRLRQAYDSIGAETCDLLDKLLTCNPSDRITATNALDHDYFWTDPLPADPKTLPSYEASHEFDRRGRRNQPPAGPHMHPDGQYRPPQAQPPPLYFGQPPPHRDTFHNGPPRSRMQPGYPQRPPHAHPPFPPGPPYGHPLNGSYPPPGQAPGPPLYRQSDRWEPPKDRPGHLPPRPPPPLGRGGGGHHNRDQRRGGYMGGGLNYG